LFALRFDWARAGTGPARCGLAVALRG